MVTYRVVDPEFFPFLSSQNPEFVFGMNWAFEDLFKARRIGGASENHSKVTTNLFLVNNEAARMSCNRQKSLENLTFYE